MPFIEVVFRDGSRQRFPLTSRRLRIGRDREKNCDILFEDDREVSREHAEVWADADGRVFVADKGSKNGTRVDESEVFRGAQRQAHRQVRVGAHVMHLIDAAPSGVGFVPGLPTGDTQFFPSTHQFDLSKQRLRVLIDFTDRLAGVFERRALLEQGLDACCEAMRFDRALLVLRTPRGAPELPVARKIKPNEAGDFPISRTVMHKALIDGERAIVGSSGDGPANLTDSIVKLSIQSALCVPITYREAILGAIYGDRTTRGEPFTREDLDFLSAIAQQLGMALSNVRMLTDHVQAQKIIAEAEQARAIQQRLLPREPLIVGGMCACGLNEPYAAIGGDYFDYFDIGDGRLGLIIADVTGHGFAAALLMANLQSAVRTAMTPLLSLPALCARLNRLVCSNTDSHTPITAIIAVADPESGEVEFVSAGHPYPILLDEQGPRLLEVQNSLLLGYVPEEVFEVHRVRLEGPESCLLFYTDGVTEAMSPTGAQLGTENLLAGLRGVGRMQADALIEHVCGLVSRHRAGTPAGDDTTLLVVQRHQ